MELRVWVDGVQRIVCGVRLTTTCQEIVFVLAKATHQAGRFTMIERWRNNERLLSPNEQPLVTLQRWGEHMNEVEFILKKASSEIQSNSNQVPQNNRAPQLPNHITNNNHDNNNQAQQQQQIVGSGSSSGNMRSSPMQSLARNGQQFMEPPTSYKHNTNQYNLNRRSLTSLGPLTSSNSALGTGSINYNPQQQVVQKTSALHPMVMRNSLSTSTLPDLPKPALNQQIINNNNNNILSANARYIEEQLMNSSPSSLYGGPLHNGYPTRSEAATVQQQHYFNNLQQAEQQQVQQQQPPKNHPFEELYSTINKKRVHNPPAVPAKPRVVVPMTSMASHPSYPPPLQSAINNAQANFFNGSRTSPLTNNIFHNNLIRPRHPPGYSDYLEAIASRNSSVIQPSSATSGLVINLGSAVNVKLPPNNLSATNQTATTLPQLQDDLLQQRPMMSRSVSEIGHDMLKMIEEQKKVLLNQKDELDRLDNDRDYWETKQNSEQVELVNRIENEIHQLEELWRENQAQISKLECQDLEKEVQDLKSEQIRIESEIKQQRNKLIRCEDMITSCRSQIDKLESELADVISNQTTVDDPIDSTEKTTTTTTTTSSKTNGTTTTTSSGDNNCVRDSDGEADLEDDSEGDYSDDLNLATSELKLRAAKDYVDKRGLISGIRSLKLDKSRAATATAALSSKQTGEHIHAI